MKARIEVTHDQFRLPDGRLARQATVFDSLGNPADVVVIYNGPPTVGGGAWIEVLASEAWAIEECVEGDLDDLLLFATFDERAKSDAAHSEHRGSK